MFSWGRCLSNWDSLKPQVLNKADALSKTIVQYRSPLLQWNPLWRQGHNKKMLSTTYFILYVSLSIADSPLIEHHKSFWNHDKTVYWISSETLLSTRYYHLLHFLPDFSFYFGIATERDFEATHSWNTTDRNFRDFCTVVHKFKNNKYISCMI